MIAEHRTPQGVGGTGEQSPFLRHLAAIPTLLDWSGRIIAAVSLGFLFVTLITNVILRYAFGSGIAWAYEIHALLLPWLVGGGIVIAAARLFWMIVTPVSPLGEWRPANVNTMSASARSALMTGFDPFNRNAPVTMAEAGSVETITDLPLTVYGIRYNAATGAGTAIIADNDGEQKIFRIGEEVSPGVTLSALEFDHVVLSRGGSRELLYLDQSQPAPSIQPAVRPEQAPPPTPSGRNRITAADLRSGVSFSPAQQGGGFAGLSIAAAGDGSVFRAAGLRDGDVVVAMGGQRITSPSQAAQLSGAFTSGSQVSLTVRRDGREVPVNITVAP